MVVTFSRCLLCQLGQKRETYLRHNSRLFEEIVVNRCASDEAINRVMDLNEFSET